MAFQPTKKETPRKKWEFFAKNEMFSLLNKTFGLKFDLYH